jgi:hypothetical protein
MKVWVQAKVVPRKWWFGRKVTYYVHTDFMEQGPYRTVDEALDQAVVLRLADMSEDRW